MCKIFFSHYIKKKLPPAIVASFSLLFTLHSFLNVGRTTKSDQPKVQRESNKIYTAWCFWFSGCSNAYEPISRERMRVNLKFELNITYLPFKLEYSIWALQSFIPYTFFPSTLLYRCNVCLYRYFCACIVRFSEHILSLGGLGFCDFSLT